MKKFLLLCCAWTSLQAFAQTDTLFWFAAPEVSIHTTNFDRPIYFRITTYNQPATVTISQPATGGMPSQVVNIPANSTQTVDATPWIDFIENKPANTTLNYGLKIQSTTMVTVYYEVVSSQCQCNPELFVLKGKNALGTDFWIPSQNYLDNQPTYTPVPFSSFDIVASENNTTVTITPSNNIVGHAAGAPFNIVLNEGQTYSATAASGSAALHLQGSRVISDKPIAVTVKDDLMNGAPFGGCADLGGDQIVPTNILGTEYIAMQGFLNGAGDQVFILGTQNGTSVNVNGVPTTTINAGQTFQMALSGSAYIESSEPIYVWHMSGYGCEVGLSILPPIVCTGSSTVTVVRSTIESLFINVMVFNGGQGNFLVNGNAGIITAGMFTAVPGTGGQWYSAQVTLPVAQYPQNTPIIVSNTSSLFHLGMIHGGPGSGTRFGYFSDFSLLSPNPNANAHNICQGDTIYFNSNFFPNSVYSWNGPAGFTSSVQNPFISNAQPLNEGWYYLDVVYANCAATDSVYVSVSTLPVVTATSNSPTCQNGSFELYATSGSSFFWSGPNGYNSSTQNPVVNNAAVNQSGYYFVTLTDTNGCSVVDSVMVTVHPLPVVSATDNGPLCSGQSLLLESYGGETYSWQGSNGFTSTQQNPSINPLIGNEGGMYTVTVTDSNGCVNTASTNVVIFNVTAAAIVSPITGEKPLEVTFTNNSTGGDLFIWNFGDGSTDTSAIFTTISHTYTDEGIYIATLTVIDGATGCQSVFTVTIIVGEPFVISIPNVFTPNGDGINDVFKINAEGIESLKVYIYNRWGTLVYEYDNMNGSWNGQINGKPASAGTYYYLVKVGVAGEEHDYTGTLMLFRD